MSEKDNATLDDMAQDLKDIKLILGGDFRTGKPGLVQSQEMVMKELYHEKSGVLKRLSSIESAKIKAVAWIGGVVFVLSLAWHSFIDWLTAHPK